MNNKQSRRRYEAKNKSRLRDGRFITGGFLRLKTFEKFMIIENTDFNHLLEANSSPKCNSVDNNNYPPYHICMTTLAHYSIW